MLPFRQTIIFLSLASVLMLGCAAGGSPSDSKTEASVGLEIRLPQKRQGLSATQNKVAKEGVGSVRIRVVAGPEAELLQEQVGDVVAGEVLNIKLEVPVGPARTFIVEVFSESNAVGEMIFQGKETRDINAGESVSLTINLVRIQIVETPPEQEFGPITLSLSAETVSLGSTVTLTASGTGISEENLVWTIDPIEGSITPSGALLIDGETANYTAPGLFPGGQTEVSVRVVNTADETFVATITINLQNPPFSIAPRDVILETSEQKSFTLSGIDVSDVNWSVNAAPAGNARLGFIDDSGNYTAPASLPIDTSLTALGVPIPLAIEATTTRPVEANAIDIASVKVTTGKDISFDKNVALSPSGFPSLPGSNGFVGPRSLVFVGGKLTATWVSNGESELTLVYSESSDGKNWSPPTPVLGEVTDAQAEPSIASGSDGKVYIVFAECRGCALADQKIRLAVKAPDETSFKEIVVTQVGRRPQFPSVAVSPAGVVFVAWSTDRGLSDSSNYDIVLQRFVFGSDGKVSDSSVTVVAEEESTEIEPALSISEAGELYLAWTRIGTNGSDVMATSSRNDGANFDAPVRVNDLGSRADRPSVAAGPSGIVYIAWQEDTCGEGCLLVAFDQGKIMDSNLKFGEDKRIAQFDSSASFYEQASPSVAWDKARGVYIAYWEFYDFNGSSGFFEGIFLVKSADNGATFADAVPIDDTNDNNFKADPSIAVDTAGRVFTSWVDSRGGRSTRHLWFARGSNVVPK